MTKAETGSGQTPYADLIDPFSLSGKDCDEYFERYSEAMGSDFGSTVIFYKGEESPDKIVQEYGLGLGARIRVYDDRRSRIDPHFTLTREGWVLENDDEIGKISLEKLLNTNLNWSFVEHGFVFEDPQP